MANRKLLFTVIIRYYFVPHLKIAWRTLANTLLTSPNHDDEINQKYPNAIWKIYEYDREWHFTSGARLHLADLFRGISLFGDWENGFSNETSLGARCSMLVPSISYIWRMIFPVHFDIPINDNFNARRTRSLFDLLIQFGDSYLTFVSIWLTFWQWRCAREYKTVY